MSDIGKTNPGSANAGWTAAAPRDEIRPEFTYYPRGGPNGKGVHIIGADA